jgi:hypothetical protein
MGQKMMDSNPQLQHRNIFYDQGRKKTAACKIAATMLPELEHQQMGFFHKSTVYATI